MAARERQVGGDHYEKLEIQPWDALEEWMSHDEFCGYLRGSALTYMVRYRDKGGVEDLKKARHTLDRLIEVEESRESTETP